MNYAAAQMCTLGDVLLTAIFGAVILHLFLFSYMTTTATPIERVPYFVVVQSDNP